MVSRPCQLRGPGQGCAEEADGRSLAPRGFAALPQPRSGRQERGAEGSGAGRGGAPGKAPRLPRAWAADMAPRVPPPRAQSPAPSPPAPPRCRVRGGQAGAPSGRRPRPALPPAPRWEPGRGGGGRHRACRRGAQPEGSGAGAGDVPPAASRPPRARVGGSATALEAAGQTGARGSSERSLRAPQRRPAAAFGEVGRAAPAGESPAPPPGSPGPSGSGPCAPPAPEAPVVPRGPEAEARRGLSRRRADGGVRAAAPRGRERSCGGTEPPREEPGAADHQVRVAAAGGQGRRARPQAGARAAGGRRGPGGLRGGSGARSAGGWSGSGCGGSREPAGRGRCRGSGGAAGICRPKAAASLPAALPVRPGPAAFPGAEEAPDLVRPSCASAAAPFGPRVPFLPCWVTGAGVIQPCRDGGSVLSPSAHSRKGSLARAVSAKGSP